MIAENDIPSHKPNGRIRTNSLMAYSGLGKLPPQAVDLEESVLGALLIQSHALLQIIDRLKPEHFYKDNHQKIYSAVVSLFSKNNPVDILTVTAQLRKQGELDMIGGAYYITELTSRVASSVNIEYHATIVIEKFMQRETIRICTESINEAYEDTSDAHDIIEKNQSAMFSVLSDKKTVSITDNATLIAQKLIELRQPEIDGLIGVGSGFLGIDKLTNGWRESELIIIAARPSMGKTAFALQLARNAAIDFDRPTLVFSLEMSKVQLSERLISSETNIFMDDIAKRRLSEYDLERIETAAGKLLQAGNIFIDDTPALNINEARAKARRLKQQHNIGMIVIDYLQLMKGNKEKNSNREQEISSISQGLKAISKELNIPVIALSQLNRAVESQPGNGKRPNLSHLRESGAIEQDADQVLFLYRPEYYGITTDEHGNSTIGLTEIIFAKNRNGICDTVKLEFNGAFMKFRDWQEHTFDQQSEKPKDFRNYSDLKKVKNIPHPDIKLEPSILFDNQDGPF
jgi:replicative DNA helicase